MTAKNKTGETLGLGCLGLFALPFATVGVVAFVAVMWLAVDVARMQFWQEVPCVILETELKEDSDSDGSTYSVQAKYRYQFNQQEHIGTRVSVTSGTDNLGSFHQQTHAILNEFKKSKAPFPCYVNPWWPSESILYRNPRWEMVLFYTMFCLMFGSIGGGLLAAVVYALWEERKTKLLVDDAQLQPWEKRVDWKQGEIHHSDKNAGKNIFWFATLVMLIGFPSLLASSWELVQHRNPWAALGLIPSGIGLIILYYGYRRLMRWQRFGDSVLQLASVPGVIGGSIAGVIRIDRRVESPDGFLVRLTCSETTSDGDGSSTKVIWEDERTIVRDLNPAMLNSSAIPVMFGIPYECIETCTGAIDGGLLVGNQDKVAWYVNIRSLTKGVDYAANFLVPVFRTSESQPDYRSDDAFIAKYESPTADATRLQAAGIELDTTLAGTLRVHFSRFRSLRYCFFLIVVQAFLATAIGAVCYFNWKIGFPYVAGLFMLGWLWSVADSFLFCSEVVATESGLSVRWGLLWLGSPREIAAGEIAKFEVRVSGQVESRNSNNAESFTAYDLYVTDQKGHSTLFAKRIMPKRAAQHVVTQLEGVLHRESKA